MLQKFVCRFNFFFRNFFEIPFIDLLIDRVVLLLDEGRPLDSSPLDDITELLDVGFAMKGGKVYKDQGLWLHGRGQRRGAANFNMPQGTLS